MEPIEVFVWIVFKGEKNWNVFLVDFRVSILKLKDQLQFVSSGIFKSTCYIDVRWFPFDVQRCDLKFGSWTYGGWSLDLQMIEADITGYIANGEWDLVGEKAQFIHILYRVFTSTNVTDLPHYYGPVKII